MADHKHKLGIQEARVLVTLENGKVRVRVRKACKVDDCPHTESSVQTMSEGYRQRLLRKSW